MFFHLYVPDVEPGRHYVQITIFKMLYAVVVLLSKVFVLKIGLRSRSLHAVSRHLFAP